MSQPVGWPSHLTVDTPPQTDGMLLLRLSGEVDVESGPSLAAAITASAGAAGGVLDMTAVTLVSAAGFRAMAGAAAQLADDGRQLLLARCRPDVLVALRQFGASGVVRMFDTVDDAIAAVADRPALGGTALARVRAQAAVLPGLLQTRPVIEGATVVIRDRYGCAGNEGAFALLRDSCQRHNIRLRTLAAAVLTTRPPAPGSLVWFAGRRRSRPPLVTFHAPRREWRDSRSAFLADVLDTALARMGTDRGDLALADPIVGGLRMELDRGLPRSFTAAFAHVGDQAAADAVRVRALRSHVRVVVSDIESSSMYTDPVVRAALVSAHARAIQSTPLMSADGRCRGTVSTMDSQAGRTPSPREAAELDVIARDAGTWLAWHQRTIVLDALEYLHQAARRAYR